MSASREKRLRRELREAEENSDIVQKKKKKTKKANPARSKKIRSIVWTIIVILLIVAFALLVFVNSGFLQKHTTAATLGDKKLTPAEFNYYYQDTFSTLQSQYSSYWSYMVDTTKDIESQDCFLADGQTWQEYLTDSAISNASQIYALYDAAQEAGFELDADTQASIDSMAESIESAAKSGGAANGDEYLEDYYGKGCDVESYTKYITMQQVAAAYATEKEESFTYTEDELRKYYDENKQDLDTVTYRLFSVATENDDTSAAKSTADAMQAELDGTEQSFIDAAREYAPEDSAESYEDEAYTLRKNTAYSSVSTDYADWLFADGRVEGESQVFATSSGYAVVMFVSRETNDYQTVDVRHILIQVKATGEDGEATEEDWASCETAFQAVRDAWEESDQTEEAFAALAEEMSEDTGSSANGGLYEDVYKGQMVEEFEDWCFDESRAAGDSGEVKSDYGYHLMYYVGQGDYYWKTLADSSKRDADYTSWFEEYSADYEGVSKAFGQFWCNKKLPSTETTAA